MQNNTFQATLAPNSGAFGMKQVILTVLADSLVMKDSKANEIFNLTSGSITDIEQDVGSITFKTASKKYRIIFWDAKKRMLRIALFGGQGTPYSPDVQAKCKAVIDSLTQHGYKVTQNKAINRSRFLRW